jgi:hypothetical protein
MANADRFTQSPHPFIARPASENEGVGSVTFVTFGIKLRILQKRPGSDPEIAASPCPRPAARRLPRRQSPLDRPIKLAGDAAILWNA